MGPLIGDKYNGIIRADYVDGSHYYGHCVQNNQQGKGWKWNPMQQWSYKGEFYDNKAHGYCHAYFINPKGRKMHWEGTMRGDKWHGLGIRTNMGTGLRKHLIHEGEPGYEKNPIELTDGQVQAIKSR